MTELTITRSWFEKGRKPKVKSFLGRKSVPYSGFISPSDGKLFVSKPVRFNFETTIQSIHEFLNSYAIPEGKKLYLILDERNEEYSEIRNSLTILSFPPYSPDLNPIEQVWRVTRHEKRHN